MWNFVKKLHWFSIFWVLEVLYKVVQLKYNWLSCRSFILRQPWARRELKGQIWEKWSKKVEVIERSHQLINMFAYYSSFCNIYLFFVSFTFLVCLLGYSRANPRKPVFHPLNFVVYINSTCLPLALFVVLVRLR